MGYLIAKLLDWSETETTLEPVESSRAPEGTAVSDPEPQSMEDLVTELLDLDLETGTALHVMRRYRCRL